eukprot:gene19973-biopygen23525
MQATSASATRYSPNFSTWLVKTKDYSTVRVANAAGPRSEPNRTKPNRTAPNRSEPHLHHPQLVGAGGGDIDTAAAI